MPHSGHIPPAGVPATPGGVLRRPERELRLTSAAEFTTTPKEKAVLSPGIAQRTRVIWSDAWKREEAKNSSMLVVAKGADIVDCQIAIYKDAHANQHTEARLLTHLESHSAILTEATKVYVYSYNSPCTACTQKLLAFGRSHPLLKLKLIYTQLYAGEKDPMGLLQSLVDTMVWSVTRYTTAGKKEAAVGFSEGFLRQLDAIEMDGRARSAKRAAEDDPAGAPPPAHREFGGSD